MVEEFYERWSDARGNNNLTTANIGLMKNQITAGNLFVEFRLLRGFVVAFKRAISKTASRGLDTSGIFEESLEAVKEMPGTVHSSVPTPGKEDNLFVLAIKTPLERMLEATRQFDKYL